MNAWNSKKYRKLEHTFGHANYKNVDYSDGIITIDWGDDEPTVCSLTEKEHKEAMLFLNYLKEKEPAKLWRIRHNNSFIFVHDGTTFYSCKGGKYNDKKFNESLKKYLDDKWEEVSKSKPGSLNFVAKWINDRIDGIGGTALSNIISSPV